VLNNLAFPVTKEDNQKTHLGQMHLHITDTNTKALEIQKSNYPGSIAEETGSPITLHIA